MFKKLIAITLILFSLSIMPSPGEESTLDKIDKEMATLERLNLELEIIRRNPDRYANTYFSLLPLDLYNYQMQSISKRIQELDAEKKKLRRIQELLMVGPFDLHMPSGIRVTGLIPGIDI